VKYDALEEYKYAKLLSATVIVAEVKAFVAQFKV
jgi:hypothetical protein